MSAWQTMDTAPKNGATILGWREDYGPIVMRWASFVDLQNEGYVRFFKLRSAPISATERYWFALAGGVCVDIETGRMPTHWRRRPRTADELENVEACDHLRCIWFEQPGIASFVRDKDLVDVLDQGGACHFFDHCPDCGERLEASE